MDREISFLRDILLHPRMDFDERKNESTIVSNNCARYFSFFFSYFSRYKQFYEFRDNSAKQRLRENRFPNSGGGRNISRSDIFQENKSNCKIS